MNKDILERLRNKSRTFKSVFSSEQGQVVLQALEDEFNHVNIKSADPHETYYRLGQRDVVVYIRQLMENLENLDARIEQHNV